MHNNLTQEEWVLLHLEEGRNITPMDALNLYGCFRLAAVIHMLREKGHDIKTTMVENPKGGKKYASYSLCGA